MNHRNVNPSERLKILFCLLAVICFLGAKAQVKVGLDTWFNHETDTKTGKPFHYLWNDTANSGYSQWGKLFIREQAKICDIAKPGEKALSGVQIYIIVDPDTTSENPSPNYIQPDDVRIITSWVRQGGVLVLLANDAPNCEFTHLNHLASQFGITFNHVTLKHVIGKNIQAGTFTNLPDNPIFKNVRKIYMKDISSLTLTKKAKPLLIEDGNIYIAESTLGTGTVLAIGDPWIYNEYIGHKYLPADYDNFRAAENLTKYLLQKSNKHKLKRSSEKLKNSN